MRILGSIAAEYRRYKTLGEGALAQLKDEELSRELSDGGNSIAVIVWHISGNLASRFTDFLTTDGEKPWRRRDEEFDARAVTRAELIDKWDRGWRVLFQALAELTDEHLDERVVIRGQTLLVHEALYRSLAHTSYHVGQIVYLGKIFRGDQWKSLSIPRGESETFNHQLRDRRT